MSSTYGTYDVIKLGIQHCVVESIIIPVYATRIEEKGGSACKVTPSSPINIDNELNKANHT